MIGKLRRYLFRLRPREKVGRIPNMYATKYKSYSRVEGDLMALLGIRSPTGVKTAMRRARVDNVADLIRKLKPFKAESPFRRRWAAMFGRIVGGMDYQPHETEINKAMRPPKQEDMTIKNRLNIQLKQYAKEKSNETD